MTTDEILDGVVERVNNKHRVILDATVLTTLMSCPRLADFRFNMNLMNIEGKGNSLEVGSIVHKFAEVYYRSLIAGLKKQEAFGFGMTAAELYIQSCKFCKDFVSTAEFPKPPCGHQSNEYPGLENTPKEPDMDDPKEKYKTGWAWALNTCEQYFDFYRNDSWVPLEAEIVKSKILYEDDEVSILWKAKLDWVGDTNQGIFPMDHKTAKANRQSIKTNNQFMGQCLIQGTKSMFINSIGFQKTLPATEKFQRKMMNYTAPQLMEWQSEILPYYAKLLLMYSETGYFPPNFTNCETKFGKCNFYEHVCTADPEMREEELKIHFKVGPEWNPTNSDGDFNIE